METFGICELSERRFEPEIVEHPYAGLDERFDGMVDAVVVPRAICVGAAQWMLELG